ncbi:MAG: hypothetical protein PVSMB7_02980 [Chloroflexota bacterium]
MKMRPWFFLHRRGRRESAGISGNAGTFPPIIGLLIFALVGVGCAAPGVPTAQNPTCSWEKAVPANADLVCRTTFRTLRTLVEAEVQGDNAPVYRLVDSRRVARRILAYGMVVRGQHFRQFHVVPSITLDIPVPGVIGANADIRAKTPTNGKVKLSETLYMRIRHGTAYVFDDQGGQEW